MEFTPEMIPTTEVMSRRRKTPLDYACLVFQALVIIAAILLIIAASGSHSKQKNKDFFVNDEIIYVVFVLIYIIYMVLEFCSTSCSYLVHKTSSVGIYDKMYKIVRHW